MPEHCYKRDDSAQKKWGSVSSWKHKQWAATHSPRLNKFQMCRGSAQQILQFYELRLKVINISAAVWCSGARKSSTGRIKCRAKRKRIRWKVQILGQVGRHQWELLTAKQRFKHLGSTLKSECVGGMLLGSGARSLTCCGSSSSSFCSVPPEVTIWSSGWSEAACPGSTSSWEPELELSALLDASADTSTGADCRTWTSRQVRGFYTSCQRHQGVHRASFYCSLRFLVSA